MIFRIPSQHVFPDPDLADPSGLLGVGGDLDPERLLLALRMGIFPWYSQGQPILWWSPDPRMVLQTSEFHVPRSLRKTMRKQPYRISIDEDFGQVLHACAAVPRPGQNGTWITDAMAAAYGHLHALGHAHSVEAWRGDELVGGLYGVAVGRVFSGESMFAAATDASKIAFATMVGQFEDWGIPLVDCQVHTEHLARFGAKEVTRAQYLRQLETLALQEPSPNAWRLPKD
jgi:leucyl/phenylalanyl-tRNA---protein transferase